MFCFDFFNRKEKKDFEIDYNIENINNEEIEKFIFTNSNSKYIAGFKFMHSFCLDIFKIDSKKQFSLIKKNSIKCGNDIRYVDFHPKYLDLILLSQISGKINLYQIKGNNESIYQLCSINAFEPASLISIFNPQEDNIILSCSNNEIKIFDLNKYTYIDQTAILKRNKYKNIIRWKSRTEFGYLEFDKLIIKDYYKEQPYEKIKITTGTLNDFYFFNENTLMTNSSDDLTIKTWDIRKPNNFISSYQNDRFFESNLFDKKLNYIY